MGGAAVGSSVEVKAPLTMWCFKVETTKKSYHQTRKEEWTAVTRENHAKADPAKSQEEVRKFTSRAERCNQEAEKVCIYTHTHAHRHTQSPVCSFFFTSQGVSVSPEKHTCVFLTV